MAKNYYEILEVSLSATQEEIKNAYRKKAKRWHPDINIKPDANEVMTQINEAYKILSNLNLRKEYDIKLMRNNKCDYFCQESDDQKLAYSSYTKSREESEYDFDEWIKDYLKKERKSHNYMGTESFTQFDIDSLKKLKEEILLGKHYLFNNDYSTESIDLKTKILHR